MENVQNLPYALFVDENYTDKDYHEELPDYLSFEKNVDGNSRKHRIFVWFILRYII